MRMQVWSLASLSGLKNLALPWAASVGLRHSLNLALLWCRLAAAPQILPIAWKLLYATGVTPKRPKKKKSGPISGFHSMIFPLELITLICPMAWFSKCPVSNSDHCNHSDLDVAMQSTLVTRTAKMSRSTLRWLRTVVGHPWSWASECPREKDTNDKVSGLVILGIVPGLQMRGSLCSAGLGSSLRGKFPEGFRASWWGPRRREVSPAHRVSASLQMTRRMPPGKRWSHGKVTVQWNGKLSDQSLVGQDVWVLVLACVLLAQWSLPKAAEWPWA